MRNKVLNDRAMIKQLKENLRQREDEFIQLSKFCNQLSAHQQALLPELYASQSVIRQLSSGKAYKPTEYEKTVLNVECLQHGIGMREDAAILEFVQACIDNRWFDEGQISIAYKRWRELHEQT